MSSLPQKIDPYAALRYPSYRYVMIGRAISLVAMQIQVVAVSWQIYQRLHEAAREAAFALGMIGLVEVIPIVLLALPAGQAADRFSRKTIAMSAQLLFSLCSLGLLLFSRYNAATWTFYLALFVAAIARAFSVPALTSLMSFLVPRPILPNAMTWNSTIFQLAAMTGPALGGGLVAAYGPEGAYQTTLVLSGIGFALFAIAAPRHKAAEKKEPVTVKSLFSGAKFVFGTPVMLGMFSLDLFAVLLGGATALLPIYAHEILHTDAWGFGLLRAAPSVGAVLMAVITTHLPPWPKAGRVMLGAVTGFGVATIIFGISTNFILSLVALAVTGACDNVSVVVRQTMIQMLTPLHLRGRVSSVAFLFISCSNDLGELESGITASWFGPVGSVLLGGIGTILVVFGIAYTFPQVMRLGRLHELKAIEVEEATEARVAQRTTN